MKKVILVISLVIAIVISAVGMVACSGDDELNDIVDYEIETKEYYIGDTLSTSDVKITATKEDETTVAVSKNLKFVDADAESLDLDEDGQFTKAGEYIVKVYGLRADDDNYFIGDWTIKVKVKK